MAASFYVYEDIDNYMLHYPTNSPKEVELPILSWHIFPKKGVWVVVDAEHRMGRASLEHSLNIILDGDKGLKRMRPPNLVDIKLDNIRFFYKTNQITFHTSEATYSYVCSRYIGDKISKGKIKDMFSPSVKVESAFIDTSRNRINLITKTPLSLHQTLAPSSPSRVVSSS